MKTKAARQPKATRQPYNSSKRTRRTRTKPKSSAGESSKASAAPAFVPPPCIPLPKSTSATGGVLFRDLCVEHIKAYYPGIQPRNDWELLYLTERRVKGTAEEIYAELDKQYIRDIESLGFEECEESAAETLNWIVEPTGVKPQPKEVNKYIHISPIPGTEYSIRLFPGSISAAEYCLDFVDSASGEPVNSPFKFELWGIPDPETPWLSMPMTQEMRSIERIHGIKQGDILPGHEKFILRDGQTCVLIRPGQPKVLFNVPIRKMPDCKPQATGEELHIIRFPKVIE
ncbi:hypothetical protein ONZ51_g12458 [Trametes cubensis]|uniref:Uncharacterized protein n=1 Tax=Trametes cubensis TaxID=1111947 RepID=A0AAD7TFP9_9APHY|nr:hypothetical protein ONZ51_g12458 [Trametes cubensis]